MKNNHSKTARKIKLDIIQKHTKAISKSFKRKGELDDSYIHKEYHYRISNDETFQALKGGCGWWYSGDPNPMYTSRNSHKKTNKR